MVEKETKSYQETGWAWVVVVGAFFIHFITAGSEKAYSVWYIELLDKFESNAAFTSGIGGLSASIRLILSPVAVELCNRFSVQLVVIVGGILSFIGLLMSAFVNSFYGVLIGYGLLYGFGLTLVFTPALIICTTYFDKRRATALSLSLTGAGFGAFFIPQLLVFLLSKYGYRGAMLIMAALTLNYCICGAVFFTPSDMLLKIKESSKPVQTDERQINSRKKMCCIPNLSSKCKIFHLFSDVLFMLYVSSYILNMMGSGPVTTLVIHFTEEFNIGLNFSVLLLAVEGGTQVIARSLSGLLFDLNVVKMIRGLVWCGVLMFSAIIVCLFAIANSFSVMVILMVFRGIFLAIYISHQTLMTCDMCEYKDSSLMSHAIGLTQLCKGIGILAGSLLSGMIKDVFNSYRLAFLFLGFSQLLGAFVALAAIVKRKHNCCRKLQPIVVEPAGNCEPNRGLLSPSITYGAFFDPHFQLRGEIDDGNIVCGHDDGIHNSAFEKNMV